jgi:hypothetical protein
LVGPIHVQALANARNGAASTEDGSETQPIPPLIFEWNLCGGQHASTRRLLLRRELRSVRHLAAERDTARNLILSQRRHFLFPHDRLFDDRRKLFLRSLGSRFLPRIELGQDFAREKFKRLADNRLGFASNGMDARNIWEPTRENL